MNEEKSSKGPLQSSQVAKNSRYFLLKFPAIFYLHCVFCSGNLVHISLCICNLGNAFILCTQWPTTCGQGENKVEIGLPRDRCIDFQLQRGELIRHAPNIHARSRANKHKPSVLLNKLVFSPLADAIKVGQEF